MSKGPKQRKSFSLDIIYKYFYKYYIQISDTSNKRLNVEKRNSKNIIFGPIILYECHWQER